MFKRVAAFSILCGCVNTYACPARCSITNIK